MLMSVQLHRLSCSPVHTACLAVHQASNKSKWKLKLAVLQKSEMFPSTNNFFGGFAMLRELFAMPCMPDAFSDGASLILLSLAKQDLLMGRRHQDKSKDSNEQAASAASDEAEDDHFAVLDDFWQGKHLACSTALLLLSFI